jgi:hypothetical protein
MLKSSSPAAKIDKYLDRFTAVLFPRGNIETLIFNWLLNFCNPGYSPVDREHARAVHQRSGRKTNRMVLGASAPVLFGLARSFLVGVISELTGFFQGLEALGTGRQPACGFESGLSRLPVFISRVGCL